ncbi:HAMP domain-containing histidine kinase [Allokutzneria sp. A3M-2-11 16]|uniref:sensor histidine kinase n=1 Tax=Allokutzneria sp. A3M-2-11 16 TaxID=2962043 RepID=UPI0020B7356A|nr:HAMP domain-containing sensor histidine kinase [Allokutzneria sp. A3M-2-11 16]MCP3800653.1 HAMP domain-containing histidine kinase [Allokutzneria sp. A3M-2-11 16]
MRWQPGLRASIALTVVLVTFVATGMVALVTYRLQVGATLDRFSASARASFESDAQQAHQFIVKTTPAGSKVDQIAEYMEGRLGLSGWAVVNLKATSGPVSPVVAGEYASVAGSSGLEEHRWPAEQVEGARRQLKPATAWAEIHGDTRLVLVGQVNPDLLLVETYTTKKLDNELAQLARQLLLVTLVVGLLGAATGVFAARRIQSRVRVAAAAARQLGAGALGTRLPVRGRDELADLATSFNTMAHRLSESIDQLRRKDQQQRRFVADVAHDLRTPLASMLAATESLRSGGPHDRERSAELLGTQVRRLSTLVEDLLEMSRFDAGAADFRPERVDLPALVADVIAMTEAEISVQTIGDTAVAGDPRRLHTIVRNLVTNALRHGGQPITVTIDGSGTGWVRVVVADSGPGLPDDLAPYVFDRFVRGDRARQHTEGSGLGLAIAYENAVLHGGRIDVSNVDGAVFTLVVPRGRSGGEPAE